MLNDKFLKNLQISCQINNGSSIVSNSYPINIVLRKNYVKLINYGDFKFCRVFENFLDVCGFRNIN